METTRTLKKDWVLTQEAFDRLLALFDADRERAGENYEILRLKLIKYFEWQDSPAPEELADETINRVARKLSEGEIIQNLNSYFYGAARHLASERRKQLERAQSVLKQMPDHTPPLQPDDAAPPRLGCCETCLSELSDEKRVLIIAYYSSDNHSKIKDHKLMARELGISLNSLRLRAHRIKLELEKCIIECENKRSAR